MRWFADETEFSAPTGQVEEAVRRWQGQDATTPPCPSVATVGRFWLANLQPPRLFEQGNQAVSELAAREIGPNIVVELRLELSHLVADVLVHRPGPQHFENLRLPPFREDSVIAKVLCRPVGPCDFKPMDKLLTLLVRN